MKEFNTVDPILETINKRCRFVIDELYKNKLSVDREQLEQAYNNELEIISSNIYGPTLLLGSDISTFLSTHSILYYFGSNMEYSLVAYLLGITKINPLEWRFRNEILYGYQKNRQPSLVLYVPARHMNTAAKIIKDNICYDDYFYLSRKSADGNNNLFNEDLPYDMGNIGLFGYGGDKNPILIISRDSLLDKVLESFDHKSVICATKCYESQIFNRIKPESLHNLITNAEALPATINRLLGISSSDDKTKIREFLLSSRTLTTVYDLYQTVALYNMTNSLGLLQALCNDSCKYEYTRDFVYEYLLEKGFPAPTAFYLMEDIRKGKGIRRENFTDIAFLFDDLQYDRLFWEIYSQVPYLTTRAATLIRTNILLFLIEFTL